MTGSDNKPSIEKMTEGFILSGTSNNNNSNNNSNDVTSTSSSTAIETPRSVTSSPEEGDDSKLVGGNLDGGLDVGNADSKADGEDNSEVTTGKYKKLDEYLIKSRASFVLRIRAL